MFCSHALSLPEKLFKEWPQNDGAHTWSCCRGAIKRLEMRVSLAGRSEGDLRCEWATRLQQQIPTCRSHVIYLKVWMTNLRLHKNKNKPAGKLDARKNQNLCFLTWISKPKVSSSDFSRTTTFLKKNRQKADFTPKNKKTNTLIN